MSQLIRIALEEPIVALRQPEVHVAEQAPAFTVRQYSPDCAVEWDAFATAAKNSTFLFQRGYMDYHRARFPDHSLMIYERGRLAALLPANLNAYGELVSHEGLTYGGLAVRREATLPEVLGCFQATLRHLEQAGIGTLLFKQIPSFYNTIPDDEMAYALFLVEAELYRRDCALVVHNGERLPVQKRRLRQLKKAAQFRVRVKRESTFGPFWERVLAPRLASRYGVAPVHSLEEITLLASRFPENIKQFSAYRGREIVAGATIYETPHVAHAQYIAATENGLAMGALDHLFNGLMDRQYKHKRCFDFGICNENGGRTVNRGLLDWKEGFGARACAHDFYRVTTAKHGKLKTALR